MICSILEKLAGGVLTLSAIQLRSGAFLAINCNATLGYGSAHFATSAKKYFVGGSEFALIFPKKVVCRTYMTPPR
jgi:hypothetical protein